MPRRFHASMKFAALVGACLVGAFATPLHAAERFRIDRDHTFAHFAVVHAGVSSVWARMGVTRGTATLDVAQETGEVSIELDVRSVDSGVKTLDAALVGELFFDTARYRAGRFTGRPVRFVDDVPTAFEGELTLHGVTRPVTLTATRFVCRQVKILVLDRYVCGGDLATTLKRSDFGMDRYPSMIGDEVRVVISVEAIREQVERTAG
jgi:polyisoprenoid-binding protein YceI